MLPRHLSYRCAPDKRKGGRSIKSNIILDDDLRFAIALLAFDVEESPFFNSLDVAYNEDRKNALKRFVDRHRVNGIVQHGLSQAASIHPDWEEPVGSDVSQLQKRYLKLAAATRTFQRILTDNSVSFAIIKGLPIAERYYPVPSLRAMLDIDVIVGHEHLSRAEALASEVDFGRLFPARSLPDSAYPAFQRVHHAATFVHPGDRIQFDLHWRFMTNRATMPQFERSWPEQTVTEQCCGFEVTTLRAPTHLAYVIMHGAKHGWVRLKWLVDVDRMVRGLTPGETDEAVRMLEQEGLRKAVGGSLCLSRELFGTPLEAHAADLAGQADAGALAGRWAQYIFTQPEGAGASGPATVLHYLRRAQLNQTLKSNPDYKIRALFDELTNPGDLETVPLGPRFAALLVIVTPVLAGWRWLRSRLVPGK